MVIRTQVPRPGFDSTSSVSIKKAATAVNDGYLKTMAQPSGVKSYGEVVDLILADYDARH